VATNYSTARLLRPRGPRLARIIGPFLPPALVLVFLLCSSFAINAELVVFTTGDVMKVSAFEIQHGDILLQLASGGRMRLPIRRIDRILDDEIVEALAPAVRVAPPPFEIGFLDTHPVPTAPYGGLIHDAARRYRVNPRLVAAMVRCESSFDPYATSPRGAAGLLQLMPATAERFGVDPLELYDPARNLEAGVRYVRWLADHFDNDLPKVLAAFNSGEGTVERFRGVPPYRETREYLRRVYLELGLASAL
jgi:soluble lytic murein transglycosylase-like protein